MLSLPSEIIMVLFRDLLFQKSSFPGLLPLTTLFYENATSAHHKWDDGSWCTQKASANAAHSPHSLHHSSWPVSLSPLAHSSATVLPNASPLASDDGFGGISHLLGYVDDDISACVYLHNLPLLCTTLQQSSWLSSCLFPTRRRRPTPPNNAAHPPIAPRR